MSGILLHLIPSALYGGLAVWLWRSRWQGAALSRPATAIHPLERGGVLLALLFHAVSLREGIFPGGESPDDKLRRGPVYSTQAA